ncbi:anthranilate synthase component II [Rhodovulum sp. DZ06]|uniref:anthranilate synthase component II n=1 Tax=Rhodovulum sp. DZ06 TaxID=3425126 RepID=UPI003D355F56
MLLLIDNYDSFTYNLVHYFGELGADVVVRRNDALTADEAVAMAPRAIVLSPGPCTPDDAGICLETVKKASSAGIPLFGVCLGHQAIGQAFGGEIVRCPEIVHGKTADILTRDESVFAGLPRKLRGTRYHSLMIRRETLPDELKITAETEDGIIMGVRHNSLPIHGVQFHPESIASEHGHAMIANFLRDAGFNVPASRLPEPA